jgi:hypothetical protein
MNKPALTYDDVLATEGARFLNRMKVYRFSYYCFHMNMLDLIQSLEQSADVAFAVDLWIVTNREKKTKAFQEIIRRFHNAVASAKSLVEHTRILVRENYSKNAIVSSAYDKKVAETFLKNGNAAVIEDLRNYFLHAGIPPVKMQLNLGAPLKHEILLNIESLKSWGRLKSQSKQYLSEFAGNIDLLTLVAQYGKTVEAFHEWFSSFLQEHHAKDLEYAYALEDAVTGVGRGATTNDG